MYQQYRESGIAPVPTGARDDAKLYKHCVIVVLLCVMAAVMIVTGMPVRSGAAAGHKGDAAAATGWSQVLVKLEAMVTSAAKS